MKARVVVIVLAGATWGCPGTLDDPARFLLDAGGTAEAGAPSEGDDAGAGGNCPDVPTLLAQTCTASTCHSASNKAQGLDLQSPDVAARLVGVPATEGAGVLIDRSAPTKSVLYEKLGATPLDAPTLACVLAWVTQAADAPGSDASAPKGSGTGSSLPDAAGDDGGSE